MSRFLSGRWPSSVPSPHDATEYVPYRTNLRVLCCRHTIHDGYTVKEYIEAVKKLEVGKITDSLVETSYGYHIIKLDEKVKNGRVNNSTERELYVNKFTDGLEKEYGVTVDQEVLNNYIISVTGNPIPAEDEETTETTEEEHEHSEDENVVEEKTAE